MMMVMMAFVVLVMVMLMVVMVLVFVMLVMMFMVMFLLMDIALDTADPACSGLGLTEVKSIGIQQLLYIDIGIIALDNLRLGLDFTDNLLDLGKCLGLDFGSLVQKNDVAELNLLNDKVFNVFITQVLAFQLFSATEFVRHPQCVHDGDNAVQLRRAEFRVHSPDGLH